MAVKQTEIDSELLTDALEKANEQALDQNQVDLPDIDINDPAALRTLAKSVLVEIVQTAPRNVSLVAAIKELLDRVDGKPMQSINQNVTGGLTVQIVRFGEGPLIEQKPQLIDGKPCV